MYGKYISLTYEVLETAGDPSTNQRMGKRYILGGTAYVIRSYYHCCSLGKGEPSQCTTLTQSAIPLSSSIDTGKRTYALACTIHSPCLSMLLFYFLSFQLPPPAVDSVPSFLFVICLVQFRSALFVSYAYCEYFYLFFILFHFRLFLSGRPQLSALLSPFPLFPPFSKINKNKPHKASFLFLLEETGRRRRRNWCSRVK